jgi:hypothetical protein
MAASKRHGRILVEIIHNQFTRRAWVMLFLMAGCAASHNGLTMTSVDHRRDYNQTFSRAYATLNENGDYDVVLVHDANVDRLPNSDGVIEPAVATPRQLVHIRVFWMAHRDVTLDHPVNSNAAIRWYLFGDRPDEAANMLEYSGSALVLVSDDGKTATVTVRGALLKAVAKRGEMSDPLGPSSVNGTIVARVDRQGVEDVLDEVKAVDGPAPIQAAAKD